MERSTALPSEPLLSNAVASNAAGAASPHEDRAAPDDTGGIIAYIVERYHKVHRAELPGLIVLAREVESVHGKHIEALRGFAKFLEEMADSLETHMQIEEHVLFPMFASGPVNKLAIEMMRLEHDYHDYQVEALEEFIAALRPPEDGSAAWHALYAGLTKFARDLAGHIRIENETLFPRFDA